MHYLSIFFKRFNKPCANFSRVWAKNEKCREILKIFDENSIEKLNFFIFFENLGLKIEPSEITPVFYNNFFRFRGGDSPLPALATPLPDTAFQSRLINEKIMFVEIFNRQTV